MTRVTCRLAAKNRDQLRNPTLGNRAWATFTFLYDSYAENLASAVELERYERALRLQGAVEKLSWIGAGGMQDQRACV